MPKLFTSHITFHQIQVLFWSFLAAFNYAIWMNFTYGPSTALLITKYGLGFCLSYALHGVYIKILTKTIRVQLLTAAVVALPVSIGWQMAVNFINITVLQPSDDILSFAKLIHNSPSSYLILLSWSVGYWLINYYQRFIAQQNQLRQIELEANQAQLKLLRFQLNPHFLFNVLSTIDTLILRKDLDASRRVLEKISDYLRETLLANDDESQCLSAEIKFLSLYIAIEQERFGDRLRFIAPKITITPDIKVPRHVLQPLAENAIKHGIAKLPSGGEITLSVEIQTPFLVISLANPILEQYTSDEGFKLGIENVQQRLNTFFQQSITIDTQKTSTQFTITLYLPIDHEDT